MSHKLRRKSTLLGANQDVYVSVIHGTYTLGSFSSVSRLLIASESRRIFQHEIVSKSTFFAFFCTAQDLLFLVNVFGWSLAKHEV